MANGAAVGGFATGFLGGLNQAQEMGDRALNMKAKKNELDKQSELDALRKEMEGISIMNQPDATAAPQSSPVPDTGALPLAPQGQMSPVAQESPLAAPAPPAASSLNYSALAQLMKVHEKAIALGDPGIAKTAEIAITKLGAGALSAATNEPTNEGKINALNALTEQAGIKFTLDKNGDIVDPIFGLGAIKPEHWAWYSGSLLENLAGDPVAAARSAFTGKLAVKQDTRADKEDTRADAAVLESARRWDKEFGLNERQVKATEANLQLARESLKSDDYFKNRAASLADFKAWDEHRQTLSYIGYLDARAGATGGKLTGPQTWSAVESATKNITTQIDQELVMGSKDSVWETARTDPALKDAIVHYGTAGIVEAGNHSPQALEVAKITAQMLNGSVDPAEVIQSGDIRFDTQAGKMYYRDIPVANSIAGELVTLFLSKGVDVPGLEPPAPNAPAAGQYSVPTQSDYGYPPSGASSFSTSSGALPLGAPSANRAPPSPLALPPR